MRCQDCNSNLSDEESTRKDESTGEYMDLCNTCLSNFYKDIGYDLPMDLLDDSSDIDETCGEDYDGEV
jgi:hypothetical protein